ncbi:sorting nexin-20-like protein [Sarcoptes scabiei]|uniref:Sorting nexin-20-like protein n=1 Tax=Sarcoptes scabiei TaxID=52283 RepID=A0A132A2R0_SARSC|nr:sorting nexin-20-like protein [Sarcoptes scabiei]
MAFQKFLTYCLSLAEIRSSKELASFLFYPELNEAKNLLKKIQLEEAANLFENVYFIQSKLLISNGRPNGQLIHTLCCLIGCLNAIDNTTEAKKLASKIFELLLENPVLMSPSKFTISDGSTSSKGSTVYEIDNLFESSPLIIPLILLSLRHDFETDDDDLVGYGADIAAEIVENDHTSQMDNYRSVCNMDYVLCLESVVQN